MNVRIIETLALLPLLHCRQGPTSIAVMGPLAADMAAEALRWRDTVKIYCLADIAINDRRIEKVKDIPKNSCNALLLSPEQAVPHFAVSVLKPGGCVQTTTVDPLKIRPLLSAMTDVAGKAVPWRAYTPSPIWGALGCIGTSPVRFRDLPKETRYLSDKYLPFLFTFSKDELPFVFSKKSL